MWKRSAILKIRFWIFWCEGFSANFPRACVLFKTKCIGLCNEIGRFDLRLPFANAPPNSISSRRFGIRLNCFAAPILQTFSHTRKLKLYTTGFIANFIEAFQIQFKTIAIGAKTFAPTRLFANIKIWKIDLNTDNTLNFNATKTLARKKLTIAPG